MEKIQNHLEWLDASVEPNSNKMAPIEAHRKEVAEKKAESSKSKEEQEGGKKKKKKAKQEAWDD